MRYWRTICVVLQASSHVTIFMQVRVLPARKFVFLVPLAAVKITKRLVILAREQLCLADLFFTTNS